MVYVSFYCDLKIVRVFCRTLYKYDIVTSVPINYVQQAPRFYEFCTEPLLQNFQINRPTCIRSVFFHFVFETSIFGTFVMKPKLCRYFRNGQLNQ